MLHKRGNPEKEEIAELKEQRRILQNGFGSGVHHLHTEPSYFATPPNCGAGYMRNICQKIVGRPVFHPSSFALSFDPRQVYFLMNSIDVPLPHLVDYRYQRRHVHHSHHIGGAKLRIRLLS